jgi:hypothetical protein
VEGEGVDYIAGAAAGVNEGSVMCRVPRRVFEEQIHYYGAGPGVTEPLDNLGVDIAVPGPTSEAVLSGSAVVIVNDNQGTEFGLGVVLRDWKRGSYSEPPIYSLEVDLFKKPGPEKVEERWQ